MTTTIKFEIELTVRKEDHVWVAYCEDLEIVCEDLGIAREDFVIVGQGSTKKKAVQDFHQDFTDTVLRKLSQARLTIALGRLVEG